MLLSIFCQTLYLIKYIIEIDDRDPPWMNDFIKNKNKQEDKALKLYKNNRMGANFSNLQNLP